jgi:4-hydroxy-4-methyl-2-oxoglutarate aldolase
MMLSKEHHARLAATPVSDISDAMERLGFQRTVITGFKASVPGQASIVGPAFTIRQVRKHYPAKPADKLTRHDEVSKVLANAGDFVVVDAAGRTDIASWGGHHSERCHTRGVSGVLINGATRDIAEIRRMGFPIFHLGVSPISSRWDQETADINGTVTVGGVQIRGGDVLVGDEDGLIVIAPEQLDRVIAELR